MFDIGFWELCVIGVVALLILGPERLPVAARTAGLWIAKARKVLGNVKSEIDRELQLDDLRKRLKEEEQNIRDESGFADLEGLAENTIADVKSYQDDVASTPVVEKEDNNDSGHGEFEPSSEPQIESNLESGLEPGIESKNDQTTESSK